MLANALKAIFGSRNDRLLKDYRRQVVSINALEKTLEKLSDAELQAKTPELKQINLSYVRSPFNLQSMVMVEQKLLEREFSADGIAVKWHTIDSGAVQSQAIAAGSLDIAGVMNTTSLLLANAGGNPLRIATGVSRPARTFALVGAKGGPKTFAELRGKKVAATKGTDPYLFLLRALHTVGLKRSNIEHVALQHADGRVALEQGRVDAWAGLDPLMAAAELNGGARLLYRNVAFNTYGFLNVRESFLQQYPDDVKRVIGHYERARKWVLANQAGAAKILADEAKVDLTVVLKRLAKLGP